MMPTQALYRTKAYKYEMVDKPFVEDIAHCCVLDQSPETKSMDEGGTRLLCNYCRRDKDTVSPWWVVDKRSACMKIVVFG